MKNLSLPFKIAIITLNLCIGEIYAQSLPTEMPAQNTYYTVKFKINDTIALSPTNPALVEQIIEAHNVILFDKIFSMVFNSSLDSLYRMRCVDCNYFLLIDDLMAISFISDVSFTGSIFPSENLGMEALELNIKIYPNPAINELFVEFPNTQGTLTMMDMLGKEVLAPIAFDGYALLNLFNLSSGVYVLRLMAGDGQVWNKHIIKN